MTAPSVYAVAAGYVAHGLSVIPVKADGSKAPLFSGWREYAERRPRDDELVHWFGNGTLAGIGIPGGPASGNLAVLDFETAAAWERWRAGVSADTADFLADCPVVRTPRGGAHVWVRLPEPVAGTVLARHADKGVMIEVRGEGHQVLAPGCPPSCHPLGKTYEFEARGWLDDDAPSVPVPLGVFAEWCERAAALSEYTAPPTRPKTSTPRDRTPTDKEPGTDFNRRASWEEAGLFGAGWSWDRQFEGDRGNVRRPGKSEGISGTVGMVTSRAQGWPLFFCFTTNGHPFEQDKPYDRFGVFARLKHDGDFKAAARALRAMGYGEPDTKTPPRKATAAVKADQPADPAPGLLAAWEIIRDYFRTKYQPGFKSGDGIYSGTELREVRRVEACAAMPPDLMGPLGLAKAAPVTNGNVNEEKLPGFFRRWAGTGWAALIAELPTEDSANTDTPAAELAADVFRSLVRDALLTEVVIGDIIGRDEVTRTERRSLIDWCVKWAKPGPWRSIRSKKCWCRTKELGGGELQLQVAIRPELFAQLKADRRLSNLTANTFARRAVRYGIGTSAREDRPHGQSAVVLTDDFVADLTAGLADSPEDGSPER